MSSSIVISFSIAILLLVVLLLLVSYNSKCKMDNIERFENDTSAGGRVVYPNNKQEPIFNHNLITADGSTPLGNIYPSDPTTLDYGIANDNFTNMNSNQIDTFQNMNSTPAPIIEKNEVVLPQDNNCFMRDRLTSSDLLPKDAANSKWAQINPSGSGMLGDQNFLTAGYHVGINTVGQSLRNANLQLRSEPPNPQVAVSPWGISTIEPDVRAVSFEIGSAPSN